MRSAGLNRIHIGLESGSDAVLKLVRKGVDKRTQIKAGRKVKQAGMELSEYVMPGLGGRDLSRDHALETADALNQIDPDFIRLRTWVPVPAAPLYEDYRSGEFEVLDPYEALRETRLLLENLEVRSWFLSDHISNFANLNGKLPGAKENLLAKIDEALKLPRDHFRDQIIHHL